MQLLFGHQGIGWRRYGLWLLVAIAYVLCARFGLKYAVVAGVVTLAWLPSGLAVASLIRLGPSAWPGVAAGAFLSNASIGMPFSVVTGISAGNTFEAAAAALVWTRLAALGAPSLRDVRGVLVLLGAAALGAVVSATAGVASLTVGDVVTRNDAPWAWLMWWMGDATGVLIAAPILMKWANHHCGRGIAHVVEALVLLVAVASTTVILFDTSEFGQVGHYPTAFAIYPFVIWAALRFGVPGAGCVTLIIALLSILGTTQGKGPFQVGLPVYSMIRWWLFNTFIATTGLLLGASSTQRRTAEAALMEAKAELEHKVAERTHVLTKVNRALQDQMALRQRLELEVIRISEDEHRKIGQELHDGLGQHLTGIAFLAEALAGQLTATLPGLAGSAQRITRLVNESISMTRSMAKGLCPVAVEAGGLVGGLTQLASLTADHHGIDCRYVGAASVEVPDRLCAINLFRIAQEAVNNAVRHGKAREVLIAITAENGRYRLSVSDDGIGFDPKRRAQPEGLGLSIMNYRANAVGATLELHWKPDGGIDVSVFFGLRISGDNSDGAS